MLSKKFYTRIYLLVVLLALFFLISPSVSGVYAQASKPQVIAQAKTNIRELPKTGLPVAALALVAALPGGLILRKISIKRQTEDTANSIWNNKHSDR